MKQASSLAVTVSPPDPDAGADVAIAATLTGLPAGAGNLRVLVRDDTSALLADAALSPAEDGKSGTASLILPAPRAIGQCHWRLEAVAVGRDGKAGTLALADARFQVQPHALALSTWDAPLSIDAGGRFKFKVGIRCSSACRMGGQSVRVIKADGEPIATATFPDTVWPETEALYATEIEATAPDSTGDHEWLIETADVDLDLPHATGLTTHRLKVVARPDCTVEIAVSDAQTQAPVPAARIVMHPYRGLTDACGIARVRVAKGTYEILVAAKSYMATRIPVDVAADITTRAELETEPPLEPLEEG